jgi:hypothetical protein
MLRSDAGKPPREERPTMTKGDAAGVSGASGYAEVNGLEMYYEIHGTG